MVEKSQIESETKEIKLNETAGYGCKSQARCRANYDTTSTKLLGVKEKFWPQTATDV